MNLIPKDAPRHTLMLKQPIVCLHTFYLLPDFGRSWEPAFDVQFPTEAPLEVKKTPPWPRISANFSLS